MKLYLRTFCFLIALLMTASACGCKPAGIGYETATPTYAETVIGEEPYSETEGTTEQHSETVTEQATEPLTETAHKEVGYYDPEIPDEPSFGGDTVKILAWSEADYGEFVFDYKNREATMLSSEIYNRNVRLEERLYINIEFVYQSGSPSNAAAWNTYLTNCVNAAAREYDFVAGSSTAIASNAVAGILVNLLDMTGDGKNDGDNEKWFSQPWWLESTSDSLIGSSLYFATGVFSPNTLGSVYAFYVNRYHLKAYNLDDPALLVDNHEWTFEKFFEMCSGAYEDVNNNGIKDHDGADGDFFSHITSETRTDAWFYATGARYCETDGSGAIAVSPTYNSDKILTAAASLAEHFGDGGTGFIADKITIPVHTFAGGGALFMTETLGAGFNEVMSSGNVDYCIIPLPKYERAQEKYLSVTNSAYSLFAVPADAPDRERAVTVLQGFAEAGYNIPSAFYEELFDEKYYADKVQSDHFDLICSNVIYDHGRLFSEELIGQNKEFREALTGGGDLSLRFKQIERVFGRSIEALNKKIK